MAILKLHTCDVQSLLIGVFSGTRWCCAFSRFNIAMHPLCFLRWLNVVAMACICMNPNEMMEGLGIVGTAENDCRKSM